MLNFGLLWEFLVAQTLETYPQILRKYLDVPFLAGHKFLMLSQSITDRS